jgi:lactate dehydrogenase-like 2-hydroxyacid dehydrogenase
MAKVIRVAVLDDYQNISQTHFQALPKDRFEVTIFRDTLLPYNQASTPEHVKSQLVERLKPFEVICTMRERTPFPKALLQKLPNLKFLLTTGVRNAAIDTEACKELKIRYVGAPGRGRSTSSTPPSFSRPPGPDSTTQHAVALILGIARNIAADDLAVKSGGWQNNINTGLNGKVFGTVGLGRLGVNVAKIMHQAFGTRVISWSANLTQEAADEKAKSAGLAVEDENGEKTFKAVSKEELFKTADVVSVHYVLSDRSRGIVGKTDLELMKNSAFLVNTSRGSLVQEQALLDVLKAGTIRGAALDVFDLEPLPQDSEWRTTKWGVDGRSHVLLSPHMGYVDQDIMNNWYAEQVENIERWHAGQELLYTLA